MSEAPSILRSLRARGDRDAALRPYIEETIVETVRFKEVDSMNIVWHGHYAEYFELARRAFGRRFGIDYDTLIANRVGLPVIHMRIDYLSPARLMDEIEIKARLLRSEAARLDFDYEICRSGEEPLLACGSTSQVFATPEGELMLAWPDFMKEPLKQWEALWVEP